MNKVIETQERVIRRIKNELVPLKKEETEARRLWSLGHNKYMSAVATLNNRRKKGLSVDVHRKGITNKLVKKLWDTLDGWDVKSAELTQRRDAARLAMDKKRQEIVQEEHLLDQLLHDYRHQIMEEDKMIDNVFMFNDGVVSSLELMDKYLSTDVFPKLHDKGSQKTFENSLFTRRLVIMTNNITIMDTSKVEEAARHINAFFARINPENKTSSKDDTILMLSDLLQELLVVKVKFKAGPNLSRFLALELDKDKFPELKEAQRLLASATNYVRSGKYVRLFTRETKEDPWHPVRQS